MEELEPRLLLTNYFVSPQGNDANPGTSTAQAWRTIDRVNQQVFRPGDSVSFKGQGSFTGSLLFDAQDIGTALAPITVTSYGTGRATIRAGQSYALGIWNTAGFNVSKLNLIGSGMNTNQDYGLLVLSTVTTPTVFEHIYIDNVDVHRFGAFGIAVDHYTTGGMYRDVRITNSEIYENLLGGVITYASYFHGTGSLSPAVSDLYIGHVNVRNSPGTPSWNGSGSGFVLTGVTNGMVERCSANDLGGNGNNLNAGIATILSDRVTLQHNEVYNIRTAGDADGDGFAFDWATTNSLMQYNYSHNNDGAGFLLYSGNTTTPLPTTGNTIRYNISENDGRKNSYGPIFVSGMTSNSEVYNNTVYLAAPANGTVPPAVNLTGWTGNGIRLRNNIFQLQGNLPLVQTGGPLVGTGLLFQGNNYYTTGSPFEIDYGGVIYTSLAAWRTASGQEMLNGQAVGSNVNPQLTNPGGGGIGDPDLLETMAAYRLASTSPLGNAGLNLEQLFGIDMGDRDFFGNTIPAGGAFSVGAHERP